MKYYLSYCSADAALGRILNDQLRVDFLPTSASTTEEISLSIKQKLAESDVFVTIISKESNNSRWQQFEWKTAMELSWSKPALKIIGIIRGRISPPSFLLNHPMIRMSKDERQEAIVNKVLNLATQPYVSSPRTSQKLRKVIKSGIAKVSAEINKFRMTDTELEKEKEWLLNEIGSLSRLDPTNVDIVKLHVKLSDILMSMGKTQEVIDVLKTGLDFLERNGEVSVMNKAMIQEKLALALGNVGKYEEAIDQICNCMNVFGIHANPLEVHNQLRQCQTNMPEYVTKISDMLESASNETSILGHRLLGTLQRFDESMNEKPVKKIGGQS